MDKKTLKKLSKKELIEKILEQSQVIENQKASLEETSKKLQDRNLKIQKAGTIAEATMLLNGVIEATEKAAAQYLENIEKLSGEQESVMRQQREEHERQMQAMFNETKEKCEAQKLKTQKECDEMIADAELQVQNRWSTLELKWETFCNARDDMQNMLQLLKREEPFSLENE